MPEVRLIDAIELVRYLCGACPSHQNGECIDKMCWKYEDRARIENAPTIEAEPVRHGRWNNTDETVWDAKEIDGKQQLEISIVAARCSACGHWSEQVNQFPPYMHYKFCPHCGARMDGGADNG